MCLLIVSLVLALLLNTSAQFTLLRIICLVFYNIHIDDGQIWEIFISFKLHYLQLPGIFLHDSILISVSIPTVIKINIFSDREQANGE